MSSEKTSVLIGTKISETRKAMGLSQEALAEEAKISLSTIQRIEKGLVSPRPYTLKTLAETLNLASSELYLNIENTEISSNEITSLKWMNLSALVLSFAPFITLIIPVIIWIMNKNLTSKNEMAGKIISFQLLWSILTLAGIMTTVFLSNLIIGSAGDGLYFSLLVYMIFVVLNIYIIAKSSSQLGKGDTKILAKVPNLF